MLWACSTSVFSPPQSWLNCFWAESRAKLHGFEPQALSNTLYACGEMEITPPQLWMDHFWMDSRAKLSSFKPQELSSALYACGKLSLMPPQDWLDCFWQESRAKLPRFDQQALANTLLSLAILEQWSSPILQSMWSALQRSLDTSKLASDSDRGFHLDQMSSVYRAAECERPGMLSFEFPGLQEEARLFRAKQSKTAVSSTLEERVHLFLTTFIGDQGISFDRNVWCDKCERHIGISLCHGDRRVAIEVDGPRYFIQAADGTHELNGLTRLQNRLLEGAGWHVISVRVPESDSDFDQQKLLQDLLVLVE